jgi:hypothetical protein
MKKLSKEETDELLKTKKRNILYFAELNSLKLNESLLIEVGDWKSECKLVSYYDNRRYTFASLGYSIYVKKLENGNYMLIKRELKQKVKDRVKNNLVKLTN